MLARRFESSLFGIFNPKDMGNQQGKSYCFLAIVRKTLLAYEKLLSRKFGLRQAKLLREIVCFCYRRPEIFVATKRYGHGLKCINQRKTTDGNAYSENGEKIILHEVNYSA